MQPWSNIALRIAAGLVLLAGVYMGVGACRSDSPAPRAGTGDTAPTLVYEDSAAGLETQLGALAAAIQDGQDARARSLALDLALDDPERWFGEVFGSALGPRLAADHAPQRGRLPELVDLIAQLVARGQTELRIERFERADDPAAVGYQARALRAMEQPVPLYSARLSDPGGQRVFHLWSFVHAAGRFRWVGKMKAVADEDAEPGTPGTPGTDDRLDELRQRDRGRLAP